MDVPQRAKKSRQHFDHEKKVLHNVKSTYIGVVNASGASYDKRSSLAVTDAEESARTDVIKNRGTPNAKNYINMVHQKSNSDLQAEDGEQTTKHNL